MNANAGMRAAGLLCAALSIGLASAGEPGDLTAVRLEAAPDGTIVLMLEGTGPLTHRDFTLADPPRLVLDLVGVAGVEEVAAPPSDWLTAVRYARRPDRNGKPVVRYVLETAIPFDYDLRDDGKRLWVTVSPAVSGASVPAEERPAVPTAAAPPAGTESARLAMNGAGEELAGGMEAAFRAAEHEGLAAAFEGAGRAGAPPSPAAPSGAEAAASRAAVPEAKSRAAELPRTTAMQSAGSRAKSTPSGTAPARDSAPPPPEPSPRELAPVRMSLDVQGAAIHTVLRSIAEYADVNIVADANVQGALTIRALDLPWPKMLAAVCEAMSLVPIEKGPVIRIATQRTAQEERLARETAARKQEEYMPLRTRIVTIDYAKAAELKETLSRIVGPRGTVEVDDRTNSLVLTDIEPKLEELEAMAHRLDTETIQVEITAKIIDVDATKSRQLGISWGISNLHSSDLDASGSVLMSAADVLDAPGELRVGVIRSFGEIEATIQALAQTNDAEIISTPRITTVDNRQASILVGKEVPLITLDYAGNAITELKKVGITLEVTPHVNANGQITMDLHPEVSDLSSQSTTQGGVVFTTTEADTRVQVLDGETAVIGGLIRGAEIHFERGVPYLKDVPLLGKLFRSSDERVEKREMLIFVTPRIVYPAQAQAAR